MGSAQVIAGLPVIPGIERLTILVDNDANGVGRKAALECATRWPKGTVKLLTPIGVKDFNDLLMRRRARSEACHD